MIYASPLSKNCHGAEVDKEQIRSEINNFTITEARKALADGKFGDPGTIVYQFATSVLAPREAAEADERASREEERSRCTLKFSRNANRLSITAIILSVAAIILSVVQWISK